MHRIIAVLLTFMVTHVSAEEVYYCQGLEFAGWSVSEQALTQYSPENFKFSIQQNQVHFGSGGVLDNEKMEITFHSSDLLTASNDIGHQAMEKGNFNYSMVGYSDIFLIAAKCDKV